MSTKADQDFFDHQHVTVIEPPAGWRMLDWRELWAYRELLGALTARDLRVRYKQTALGAAWALLRPLTMMLIFSLVFGTFARMPSDGMPYPVFVLSGLLPWTFFSSSLAACGQSLVGSSHLVSKVYFPRLIIPLSVLGVTLIDMLVAGALLLGAMIWYGVPWTWNLLALPALVLLLFAAALGVGTLLAALTVAYRDFTHITPFLMQIWMYVTPVVFPISIVPTSWRWVFLANPMTGIVGGFRSALLGSPFDVSSLISASVVTISMLAVGIAYFERVERGFADII